jgi:glycosyltransferase involved in cell wall biosynthesis
MDYRPNIEAVTAFARDVMPRLPGVRFAVAGRNPAPEVLALKGQGVVVTGAVDDMRSWLAAADIVVAPLGIARGIQNKVLEAMAMARAVVASPAAFEGIEAEAGKDLIVAKGAEAQAAAIQALLADPERANALGASARDRMDRHYRWDARLAGLAHLVFPATHKAAA